MDPHQVLQLPRDGYTLDQLNQNYRLLARQLHPDKRGASMDAQAATELFQILQESYRTMKERLEADAGAGRRERPRPRAEPPPAAAAAPPSSSADRGFDVGRFNRVFEENRMEDPVVDGGYGRWMEEAPPDACASVNAHLARRDEPQPTAICHRGGTPYSEIGSRGVDDYSRADALSTRHGIQYSDYRVAHTTTKLASEEDFRAAEERARRELRSIDTLQQHRATLAYDMTDADRRREAERLRARDAAEERRLDAVAAYDRMLGRFQERTRNLLM